MVEEKVCPVCKKEISKVGAALHCAKHFPQGKPNPDLYPLSASDYDKLINMARKER